jgi:hypothetical protein
LTARVCIVMPAYNAEATIRAAIESVLSQSFADFELVVCDDASRDNTAAIVESMSDPRIRLLRNEHNAGEGATRDRAIAQARAGWIAVLDADDAWAPGRLQALVDAAGDDESVMVFDDLMKCHDTPSGMAPWQPLRGEGAFGCEGPGPCDVPVADFLRSERLLVKPLFPARLVRERGIVHGPSRFGADTHFFLQLIAAGLRLRYVPRPFYLYRLTPGSATANPQRHRLMRECVENALAWEGFDAPERAALREKVRALRRNETYALFVAAARSRRPVAAIALLLRHPWILARGLRRLLRGKRYEAHRLAHGGRRRSDA